MQNPDAIIIGDIQANHRQPVCRVDDFWEAQIRKGRWLRSLWEECNRCPVLQPGDIFEDWRAYPQTITMMLEHYPPMICIPGNHDLPYQGLSMYEKSALNTLQSSWWTWQVLTVQGAYLKRGTGISIDIMPWGVKEPIRSPFKGDRRVLLAHVEIANASPNDPMYAVWENAHEFAHRFIYYDLIITGHNHTPFFQEFFRGRFLVNPGSFLRQTADETHEPRVYLWYAEDNRIEKVIVPHDPAAISRAHIEAREHRDEKIDAFIEKVRVAAGGDVEEVSFEKNLEKVLAEEAVNEEIKERARWALGKEKE